jgi:hypothetical protein
VTTQSLPPHRERQIVHVAQGWVAECACHFQTRALASEDLAREQLDDHIGYLTTVGLNEVPRS